MEMQVMFSVSIWVILAVFLPVTSSMPSPGSYYTDEAARRLLHYDIQTGDCVLFGDQRIVDEILRELAASESPVSVLEATELTALISACYKQDLLNGNGEAPPAENFPHIIYPGTKWCGTGNAAQGLDDLGLLKEVDSCCRDHDLCPEDLEPGQTKHNITNETPFTILHCDCNAKFRECLTKVGSSAAKQVGIAYFSTGLFQCFKLEKPTKGCLKWAGLLTQACQEYESFQDEEPYWQLFDMKAYE